MPFLTRGLFWTWPKGENTWRLGTMVSEQTSRVHALLNKDETLCIPFVIIELGSSYELLLTARPRNPADSEAVHAPEWSTSCAGISPSSVGISSATVSVVPGYCVR